MPRPRKEQVNLESTPYYHVISRCVRRAHLCGRDPITGRNFSHRKVWIRARLAQLVECFAVDLGAFTVLDNHYHALVHVDAQRARAWDEREVARRWLSLFKGPLLVRRWMNGEAITGEELEQVREDITKWRARLHDLSWFMKCLNEYIARRANKEDQCKGRFWEERFVSQALLDDPAVLGCMVYIDLNPVRAGLAQTPEDSDHTSIQQRLEDHFGEPVKQDPSRPRLLPLAGPHEPAHAEQGPFATRLTDYLALVDWTGRSIRSDKSGAIPTAMPPLLERLQLDRKRWLTRMGGGLPVPRPVALGDVSSIQRFAEMTRRRWVKYASEASCFSPSGPG